MYVKQIWKCYMYRQKGHLLYLILTLFWIVPKLPFTFWLTVVMCVFQAMDHAWLITCCILGLNASRSMYPQRWCSNCLSVHQTSSPRCVHGTRGWEKPQASRDLLTFQGPCRPLQTILASLRASWLIKSSTMTLVYFSVHTWVQLLTDMMHILAHVINTWW